VFSKWLGKNKTRGGSHQWNSADTDLESGAEARNVEEEFKEEEEEQQQQQQQQAKAEDKPQAATSGGRLPNWGPPQERNTNIHPFVGPAKDVKEKLGSTHQNRQFVTVCFDVSTEIFHLLVEQTNVYYQQHWNG